MSLCIIPARGGSQRILRKNIKQFLGKPIILYAIENALNSTIFQKVLVSTDDLEIAEIAKSGGAEVHLRSSELADHRTGIQAVISNVISELDLTTKVDLKVCCLFPCTPLIGPEALYDSSEMLGQSEFKQIMSITKFPSGIERSMKKEEDGNIFFGSLESGFANTNNLQSHYFDSGQFYWRFAPNWQIKSFPKTFGFELPIYRGIDIDTEEDWQLAEYFYVLNKNFKNVKKGIL